MTGEPTDRRLPAAFDKTALREAHAGRFRFSRAQQWRGYAILAVIAAVFGWGGSGLGFGPYPPTVLAAAGLGPLIVLLYRLDPCVLPIAVFAGSAAVAALARHVSDASSRPLSFIGLHAVFLLAAAAVGGLAGVAMYHNIDERLFRDDEPRE